MSANGSPREARTTHHLGVWPPLLSVSVFLASFPSLIAQYGSCLPIVFRFGKFFARSTTATSVPISGPSSDISAKMPAVWAALTAFGRAVIAAISSSLPVWVDVGRRDVSTQGYVDSKGSRRLHFVVGIGRKPGMQSDRAAAEVFTVQLKLGRNVV
jgi:hypothetical protein